MEVGVTYLVDKSALARLPFPDVYAVIAPLLVADRIATCGIVDLEVLFSARNSRDMAALRRERSALVQIPIVDHDFRRAMDVMAMLAEHGQHRSARIPDLLIAAVAERTNLCVLHYDQHFDRIAEVTGQPVKWVVPRGTV